MFLISSFNFLSCENDIAKNDISSKTVSREFSHFYFSWFLISWFFADMKQTSRSLQTHTERSKFFTFSEKNKISPILRSTYILEKCSLKMNLIFKIKYLKYSICRMYCTVHKMAYSVFINREFDLRNLLIYNTINVSHLLVGFDSLHWLYNVH